MLQLDEMLLRCMCTRLGRGLGFLVSIAKDINVHNSCMMVLSACMPTVSLYCLAACVSNECF